MICCHVCALMSELGWQSIVLRASWVLPSVLSVAWIVTGMPCNMLATLKVHIRHLRHCPDCRAAQDGSP